MTAIQRWWAIGAAAFLAVALGAGPAAAAPPPPNSMAAAGDSITRAFDVLGPGCAPLADCPQFSWSTGDDVAVASQYQRLLALNPGLAGHQVNVAATGANMSALSGQLTRPEALASEYVTVLMGANDLCTSSPATMTPTADFTAQLRAALAGFFGGNPTGLIYLSSLPDIYQLWSVLHNNPLARATWAAARICQSMLSEFNTEAVRQQVVTREGEYNAALAAVCAEFAGCLWDNLAGYGYRFSAAEVSSLDYFHPNVAGQNALADTSWAAGYWGP